MVAFKASENNQQMSIYSHLKSDNIVECLLFPYSAKYGNETWMATEAAAELLIGRSRIGRRARDHEEYRTRKQGKTAL